MEGKTQSCCAWWFPWFPFLLPDIFTIADRIPSFLQQLLNNKVPGNLETLQSRVHLVHREFPAIPLRCQCSLTTTHSVVSFSSIKCAFLDLLCRWKKAEQVKRSYFSSMSHQLSGSVRDIFTEQVESALSGLNEDTLTSFSCFLTTPVGC